MQLASLLVIALAATPFSDAAHEGPRSRLAKRDYASWANRRCDRGTTNFKYQTFNFTDIGTGRPASQVAVELEVAALRPMSRILQHIVRQGLRTPVTDAEWLDIISLGPRPLVDFFRGFSNNNGIVDTSNLYTTSGNCGTLPCPPTAMNMELTIPGAIQKALFDYHTICEMFSGTVYPYSTTAAGCSLTNNGGLGTRWWIHPDTGAKTCSFDPNSSSGLSLDVLEALRQDGAFSTTAKFFHTPSFVSNLNQGVSPAIFLGSIYTLRRTVDGVGNLPDSQFTLNGGFTPVITSANLTTHSLGALTTTTGQFGLRGWGSNAPTLVNNAITTFVNNMFRISGAISRALADPNWPAIKLALQQNSVSGVCASIQCVCPGNAVQTLYNPLTQQNEETGGTLPAANLTYQYWSGWTFKPQEQSKLFSTPGAWNRVCTSADIIPGTSIQCCSSGS